MIKNHATQSEQAFISGIIQKGIPLSFDYNGVPFPAEFDCTEKNIYTHSQAGLTMRVALEEYPGSSAYEWTVYLENNSDKDTEIIDSLLPLDLSVACGGDMIISYSKGTCAQIDDFSYQETRVSDNFELSSPGSRLYLPFFNLDCGGNGYIIGLGWTGNWKLKAEKDGDHFRITAGMPATHFILHPGETVRSPRVLVIYWEGEKARSFNMLRRHLAEHHIPCDEKGEPTPPICCNTWGGMKAASHIKYINFIKENNLKYDLYWIDAGWYGPDHETEEFQNFYVEDWAYNGGEWRFNRAVYPNGFKEVADAAEAAGMKVLLWFGSFACREGLGWQKEHPEWGPLGPEGPIGLNPKLARYAYINFTIPEARKWLIDKISSVMIENNVTGYREDTGLPSGEADTPDRIGVGEMKLMQYFYEYWDELREKIPGLFIDNCGGGGSRVDLETISRSYVLWRSDYNCNPAADPIGAQVGNYGLGHWVPLVNGAAPSNPGSTYSFRSGLYGGMGFGMFHPCGYGYAPTFPEDNYPVAWHREMLDQYQLAKPYLSGDFYPLTQCTTNTTDWLAYYFDRPDLGGGVIMGFRRQDCTEESITVVLNLEKGAYRFKNLDTGEISEREVDGAFEYVLKADKQPGSVSVFYEKSTAPSDCSGN